MRQFRPIRIDEKAIETLDALLFPEGDYETQDWDSDTLGEIANIMARYKVEEGAQ